MQSYGSPAFVFDETAVAAAVESWLNHIAGALRLPDRLSVRIEAPDTDKVKWCFTRNCTSTACVQVQSINGATEHPLAFEIPYPHQGVFVGTGREYGELRAARAKLYVWHPRLVTRPGLWLVRPRPKKEKQQCELRLGLTGSRDLTSKGRDVDSGQRRSRRLVRSLIPQQAIARQMEESQLCKALRGARELRSSICDSGHGLAGDADLGSWTNRLCQMLEWLPAGYEGDQFCLDPDDLAYQRLYTYSVFTVENCVQGIAEQFVNWRENGGKHDEGSLWRALQVARVEAEFLARLSNRQKAGWLRPFDPLNVVDAISDLTGFTRYDYPGDALSQLPYGHRQNHPSYRGLVCPVQTPESDRVGVELHLAAGVTTDVTGVLLPSTRNEHGLGYAAATLPFYQNNDGARSSMGSKNLVGSLPVHEPDRPLVTTGIEKVIASLLTPLGEPGLIPDDRGFWCPGRNLLVAYMCWDGWNYEDAIVANRELIGPMDHTATQHFAIYLRSGVFPLIAGLEEHSNDLTQVHPPGFVQPDEDLVRLIDKATGQIRSVKCREKGHLKQATFHAPPNDLCGGMLEWEIECDRPLGLGDKLMGRHGNKGVISLLLSPSEMPRLPDDPRLGRLAGRHVDLILNPHGVISRMNVGQLIETHVGLLRYLNIGDIDEEIGRPFGDVDLGSIQEHLLSINKGQTPEIVDNCGRVYLTLPNGSRTEAPVVVGFQYVVRLDQVPSEKAHVRTRGGETGYDPRTGQAVRGRQAGGGQRLGEMEMWALQAYQADELIELFIRDSVECTGDREDASQTFLAIVDFLLALGIIFHKATKDTYFLKWAENTYNAKPGTEVATAEAWRAGIRGPYRCNESGCTEVFEGLDVRGTGAVQRSARILLTVGDVLRDAGYTLRSPSGLSSPLKPSTQRRKATLRLSHAAPDEPHPQVPIEFNFKRRSIELSFAINGRTYHGYTQWDSDTVCLRDMLDVPIVCPKHRRVPLLSAGEVPAPTPVFGGLADPGIFVNDDTWGIIQIPEQIDLPYPLTVKDADRPPKLRTLRVLPLKYRTFRIVGVRAESDETTEAYTQVLRAIIRYEKVMAAKAPKTEQDKAGRQVSAAVRDLLVGIKDALFGKSGLIRYHGGGRRVDHSGRFVIVPDPGLRWDECALPLEAILAWYGKAIAHWVHRVLSPADVERICPGLSDFLFGYQWPERVPAEFADELAAAADRYLEANRQLVLLNRQPTLHRYNVKAARVRLLKMSGPLDADALMAGRMRDSPLVVAVHPLICSSMGADFDGDEMTVHCLRSPEDVSCAENLLPSHRKNLLSLATGDPVAGFNQDFVLGTFLISGSSTLRSQFLATIPVSDCPDCRVPCAKAEWNRPAALDLMRHLCTSHPDLAPERIQTWMRDAFKTVTTQGVSFGAFDIQALHNGLTAAGSALSPKDDRKGVQSGRAENERLADAVRQHLRSVLAKGDTHAPGYAVAAMALSGARGNFEQLRQLIAARGYLDPGAIDFKCGPEDRFFVESALITGMDPEDAFYAAMNARSSLADKKLLTSKAGELLRDLVMACRPWRVKAGDCHVAADKRSPLTCLWHSEHRFCSACYGRLPNGEEPGDRCPVGLIAAQSFGERGSQLSMQGSHTSMRVSPIQDVYAWLNQKRTLGEPPRASQASYGAFLDGMRSFAAYNDVRDVHVEVLWCALAVTEHGTLKDAVKSVAARDLFAGLVGSMQWAFVLKAIREEIRSDPDSPWGQVTRGGRGPIAWTEGGELEL